MKKSVLLLVLFLLCGHLQAQAAIPLQNARQSGENHSKADTVNALHRLFAKRRSGAQFNTGTTSYIFLLPSIALLALESNPAGVLVVGASMGIGIGKAIRFSPKKETALIAAYQNNQPLPSKMRKRLKQKFFK